ncbi:hypothetical protein FRC11_013343 [Ceratobasidium sp. 423]|nr:hypothetical protein FRC11_013343 [Ceratobasidium sp. 423]
MPEGAASLPAPLPPARPHGHPGDENYEDRDSFFYAQETDQPTPYHPIMWKLRQTLPGPLPSQADREARARGAYGFGGILPGLGTGTLGSAVTSVFVAQVSEPRSALSTAVCNAVNKPLASVYYVIKRGHSMANTTPRPTHITLPENTCEFWQLMYPQPMDVGTELAPVGESALESSSTEQTPAESTSSPAPHHRVAAPQSTQPKPPRVSFSRPPANEHQSIRRPSRGGNSIFGRSSSRRVGDDPAGLLLPNAWGAEGHDDDKPPPIPSALNPSLDATPLPVLSIIVLSIALLGEFLSANVSTPFIIKMVGGFFKDPKNNPSEPDNSQENEADVGYWAGILVSVFFITQFMTSLPWATVADKHGRRAVLFISLLGNALTCTMFGFATTLPQAIVIRLAQGVFNGAVGVARGTVAGITDSSNEGRAYSILGFSWGFGGVAGAIIGGTLESPADKWPEFFADGRYPLLVSYPYFLPCFTASCVTGLGAFLCLFLGWDGGPRSGLIRLPDDEVGKPTDEEQAPGPSHVEGPSPPGPLQGVARKVSQRFSGYFAQRVRENSRNSSPVPLASPANGNGRSASVGIGTGSAYGYRSRMNSVAASVRRRRASMASTTRTRAGDGFVGSYTNQDENIGLAQRLLMANENNVTNMTDLWVAAAITADEEVFEDWDSDVSGSDDDTRPQASTDASPSQLSPGQQQPSPARRPSSSHRSYTRSPSRQGIQLPLVIIFQYGLLALHGTTHDQIFLSYLVSYYKAGGLGLDPGHFAQLIALMCLAQIVFQFHLYPNIGPPLGRFSHLAMFRIGNALFIPAYLSVVLYRHFASADSGGSLPIMILLSISTAIRYCGSTFAYTSVAVLLNYMSPPHVVSLSNGMAQSVVSLARFIGPVFGGYVSVTSDSVPIFH